MSPFVGKWLPVTVGRKPDGYANGKVLYRWPRGSHYHKDRYCSTVPHWHAAPAGFLQGPLNEPDDDIPDKEKCSRCWRLW